MIFVHILEPLAALLCATFNWQEGPIKGTQLLVPPKGVNFLVYGTFLLLLLFVFFFLLLLQFHFFFHFPYFFYIACTLSLKLKKNIAIKSCTIASKVKINVFIELFFLPQSKLRSGKKKSKLILIFHLLRQRVRLF